MGHEPASEPDGSRPDGPRVDGPRPDGLRPDGLRVEPLSSEHDLDSFRCDRPAVHEYLRRDALADQASHRARTFVALRDERVVAYFTISAGSVEAALSPEEIVARRRRRVVPVVVIARVGIGACDEGSGSREAEQIMESLVLQALYRATAAAETISARALIVSARDDEVRSVMRGYGFECLPTSPFHLFLTLAEARASIRVRGQGVPV